MPFAAIGKFALLLAMAVIVINLSGCLSKRYHNLPTFSTLPFGDPKNTSVGRFKTTYLAQQIHAFYNGSSSGPIAITTFVDANNLYSSSAFGRLLSEQLISELAMDGYSVVELRHSEVMQVMLDHGEFGLSRDVSVLKNSRDISGLVVGTYIVSPDRVYINARLLDPNNSYILSAASVEIDRDDEVDRLLRTSQLPVTTERVPVRNLGISSAPVSPSRPYSLEESRQLFNEKNPYRSETPPSPKITNSPSKPSGDVS